MSLLFQESKFMIITSKLNKFKRHSIPFNHEFINFIIHLKQEAFLVKRSIHIFLLLSKLELYLKLKLTYYRLISLATRSVGWFAHIFTNDYFFSYRN